MKAVIEFEVEDCEDFIRQWETSSLPDEDWYLVDGAEQKVYAKEVEKDFEDEQTEDTGYRTDNKKAYLLEELADLEHKQWMHWSQYVAEEYDIPKELREKWAENWIPYSELSEEMKDKDRKWARKALQIIEDQVYFGDFGETDK